MSTESLAGFRLSPQQERVVSIAGDAGYPVSAFLYECNEPLTVDGLRRALGVVTRRNEILRTVFRKQRELTMPLQIILEEDAADVRVESLEGLPGAQQKAELERRFSGAAREMRPASDAPVVSCTLFELGEDKCALLVTMPGLCADAASAANLGAELSGALKGDAPTEDPLQYADVTEWQHDLLGADDEAAKGAKAFWRGQVHTPLVLPLECGPGTGTFDRVGVAVAGGAGADVLLAVWVLLLSRVSGVGRTVVLAASDEREYDEMKGAIGLFARYLPVAVQVEGKRTFEDLVREVEAQAKQARSQQDWFVPGSSSADAGIGFEYHDLRGSDGAAVRAVAVHVGLERLKLRLIATELGDGLRVDFEYDSGRYGRDFVERLAASFEALLRQVGGEPAIELRRLSLVDGAARTKLLEMGLGAVVSFPEGSIHALISAQALRTPGAAAVRCGEDVLTYAELESRSNSLVRFLVSLGVKRGALVGLSVARSAEMMVAVLGILKAGGAYVPLSADQPKVRTEQQLAGISVLVTERQFVAELPEFAGKVVVLDEGAWGGESGEALDVAVGEEDLAYVIYTSGSTGTPKGVGVRHRNLVNYATHIVRVLGLDAQALQYGTVSTLAADLGNTVIYPALLTGGCLHVLPYEVATDPQKMAAYQAEYGLDVLKIVPSHLAALLDGAGDAVLPRRYLITGGEALKPALLERVVGRGTCELINHYGPTETTVGSLMLPVKEFDWKGSGAATVPIGRPIANTRVYVLDANRELVPVGVAGELYIAGAGVSAGYVGLEAMTSERFVGDAFHAGEVMYKTGDLVRWLPSGVVEFLGRADDQVKIRGFRVELGEIEAVLAREAGVRQGVVVARLRDEASDDKQLVAYVVLERGATVESLKSGLKERLPDYMVPAAMVELKKIPLTANGKVDKKALPAPDENAVKEYKAPATVTEELVAQIWAEVLKVDRVSTEANFFDLGGHSLLATQVISRIRRVLGVDLPLRVMFDTPVIAKIAERLEADRVDGAAEAVPEMTRVPREGALPLSFAQQRLWILDQMEPNNPMYNIPRMMRLEGELNVAALQKSLNEIVRRHEPLRTWFGTENGAPVQHIEADAELRVKIVDLSDEDAEAREAKARELVAQEAGTPFDLSHAPLLRATLLKLGEEDHVLSLTMHHIVSDAWSAALFQQELGSLYESFGKGGASELPELTMQYADYAAWQRNWLQGETLARQLGFWREQLGGAPALLTLPTDRPRPEKQTFEGRLLKFQIPAETSAAVKVLCRREGVTLFMMLLAVYQTLLSRLSGQEQVVVGTDSANRFTVETERMIGFFINLVPLKADLSGNPTFREVLGRVRETTLACYAHQEMPFDKVVEELRPDRNLSHNPIVQVLFVMQNTPATGSQIGGVKVSGFGVPLTRSKFDVAVFATERNEGIELIWVYSTELFEAARITSMAEMFETLLANAVAEPDTRIKTLELMTEAQKARLKEEQQDRKRSGLKKLMV